MLGEIQELLDQYLKWLKDKTVLKSVKDWVEITTPYLDRHNDYLQLYVKRDNDGYILTDDGHTIADLQQSGCELETKKRKDLLTQTLNGFGIKLIDEELRVIASPENFALKKHNLVQAMLAINDLFYLAEPTVASIFLEDVTSWLIRSEIRYTPRVKFSGKSGYDHLFDFVIPASKAKPERILQAINRPRKDAVQTFAFSWVDTREVRPENSLSYAFLNDSDHTPDSQIISALKNYEITPVLWSKRESVKKELAA